MAGPQGLTGRSTILDVAAAAGVSRQTVTRAMNGMPDISTTTKERVLAAADRLGYRPSRFGRGLATGGDPQLGLLVEDLTNPYFPELAAAIVRKAGARGWTVLLAEGTGAPAGALEALEGQTDAVVGHFGPRADRWLDRPGGAPVVGLDVRADATHPGVRFDRAAAVNELTEHLVRAGVRRPAVLDASPDGTPSERGALLVEAFQRLGTRCRLLGGDGEDAARGAADSAALLASPDRPDAIVAFNDLMALGVLSTCRRAGVDVPGEVRVAGIDGLPVGALVAPTLTTLAVDLDAVAREAVDLAIALRDGAPADGPDARRTVHSRLVVRESA
jgi:DNA-binding LacI/PurR family transcriptional regulator